MAQIPKTRCDQLLLEKDLVDSIEEAQALVMAGKVIANDQRVDLPSQLIRNDALIRVKTKRFVSRGGDKLQGALEHFDLATTMANRVVLDVGCSTGGFTDCCLKLGAAKVYAVDVGANVLDWGLRQNPRVSALESCDIRKVNPTDLPNIDLVVADISFNSLQILMKPLLRFAKTGGTDFLLLIKPQFELPREMVPAGGVVTDSGTRQLAVKAVSDAMADFGIDKFQAVDSLVAGRRGNVEIFIYFRFSPTTMSS